MPDMNVEDILAADDPVKRFQSLRPRQQANIFFLLPEHMQDAVLERLKRKEIRRFLKHMDADEATDVLQRLPEKRRKKILKKMNAEMREKVEFLLRFNPETAAGVMSLDYVTVDVDDSFRDVAGAVDRYEEKTGRFPTVLVERDGTFMGELPGTALAKQEQGEERIEPYVRERPAVAYDDPDTDIVETFRADPHGKVVVLDEDATIMGVIYSEDILNLIEEEAGETLYDFAGVREEEGVWDGPGAKVRNRYKWLILNLGTAFLAAMTVGLFEDTIAAFTLLAVYMPIVAGMGGNAGTQSMAVVVRGLALNQVSLATGSRVILNEVLAGAVNGTINGVLVAAIAVLINKSPLLGLVLAVSMVANLIIAGFFGAMIPLVLKRMDIDPATSATIFITTATDVLGFFVFLGLATIIL